VIAVSYDQNIGIASFRPLLLSQYTHLTDRPTDGETDRIATAIPWCYFSGRWTLHCHCQQLVIERLFWRARWFACH